MSSRNALAVRYPWVGWDYSLIGTGYAHRSLHTGEGEPIYTTEPTPTRAAMKRKLLTTTNSKRELITWRHSHTWNHTTEKGGYYWSRPDVWWVDNDASHPATNYGAGWLSPQPMSDTAKWAAPDTDPPTWAEPTAGVSLAQLVIFSSPVTIQATMNWTVADGIANEVFDIKRKCSRVLCYKDCTHTNGTISFAPSSPSAILRPNVAGSGTAVVTVDPRWEPFGWADQLTYSVGYQLDSDGALNEPPEHTSDVTSWQENNFATGDLSYLSATKISDGFKYSSGHSDNGFYTWQYIEDGQPFDLIIEASFYRYKRYQYDSEAAGSGMEKMVPHPTDPSGFAGIYGTCHVLF